MKTVNESKIKAKFLLYTNPNNITNNAYIVVGNDEVRNVIQSSKKYPGSYNILYQGKGTNSDLQKIKSMYSNYVFNNITIR